MSKHHKPSPPTFFGRSLDSVTGEESWEFYGEDGDRVFIERANDDEWHAYCEIDIGGSSIEIGTDLFSTAQDAASALEETVTGVVNVIAKWRAG